jgi:hypothetical protein
MKPHGAVLGLENRTDSPHWRSAPLCAAIAFRKWRSAVAGTFCGLGIIRGTDKNQVAIMHDALSSAFRAFKHPIENRYCHLTALRDTLRLATNGINRQGPDKRRIKWNSQKTTSPDTRQFGGGLLPVLRVACSVAHISRWLDEKESCHGKILGITLNWLCPDQPSSDSDGTQIRNNPNAASVMGFLLASTFYSGADESFGQVFGMPDAAAILPGRARQAPRYL